MAITAGDVQILFADLQENLVEGSVTAPPDALDRSASVLAEMAVLLGLPMTFSAVPEPGGPPRMVPALRPYAKASNTFLRDCASPFMNGATVAALAATGRRTLVVAGFAAEVVVLHAALDAIAAGYDVQLPLDAVGGLSARTEVAALRQMERAGGLPTSVASLVTTLAPDFSRPPGRMVLAAVRRLSAR